MSGGTPVGGGYMRQRHSQGYASSGDDLEDDACSRSRPASPASPRNRKWIEIMENFLWLASATFIIYYGDGHSNLIYLLWHDGRIRRFQIISEIHGARIVLCQSMQLHGKHLKYRLPLYLGMVGVGLNIVIFFYSSMSAWGVRRLDEKWELNSISALPFVTLLGLVSFCLFSFALWPIWSFLTLPLLFTLFMASMVIFPYISTGTFQPQYDMFRTD